MLTDPLVIYFVVGALTVLACGLAMAMLRQPIITGYLLAGLALGPHGLAFFTDPVIVGQLGAIGVVLLLFFIGMEISPQQVVRNWRVAIIGTSLQILISVALVWIIGWQFQWPLARVVLIGFVVSLSCTAVVVDYLKRRDELDTRVGQDTLMILIAQDIFVIPMLIVLGLLGGSGVDAQTLSLQLACGAGVVALMAWILRREGVDIPGVRFVARHPELQVFLALLLCFGLAFITGLMQLSTALGAFIAGIIVGQARDVPWVKGHLDSLRVVFIAIFFASIGMLIDLNFIASHWKQILLLVLVIFITNTLINAVIMNTLGESWPESVYAGALLAHVGEFSFVLAAIGQTAGIVTGVSYQLTIAVIAISLALGPAWVMLIRWLLLRNKQLSSRV